MRARREGLLAVLLAAALGGCGGGDTVEGEAPAAPDRIQLESPAFRDGATIPEQFTCDGVESAPPLRWFGVPGRARELALVMEDPDAPGGTFVHWTVYGLPPSARHPDGGRQGENSFGDRGYGGPCPPEGDEPHHYQFVVYALDEPIGLEAGAGPEAVLGAIGRRAIVSGRLAGRYGR